MFEEPRAGSAVALDQRIARLEIEQGKLSSDMALIKLEQQHQREIMQGRFGAIDANLNSLTSKIDLFLDRTATAAGDITATAAGRIIAQDVAKLNLKVDSLKERADEAAGAMNLIRYVASGGIISGLAALITVVLRIQGVVK